VPISQISTTESGQDGNQDVDLSHTNESFEMSTIDLRGMSTLPTNFYPCHFTSIVINTVISSLRSL
jgi:hypothetical protein